MVYLILGKQQVLQQQAIDAFTSLIPENEQVMNVGRYDMEATPLAVALDDAIATHFWRAAIGYHQ